MGGYHNFTAAILITYFSMNSHFEHFGQNTSRENTKEIKFKHDKIPKGTIQKYLSSNLEKNSILYLAGRAEV